MPMTWVGRLQGFRRIDRVFGPDFMAAMCELSAQRGFRHFFYGGRPGVAQLLKDSLERRFPGLSIVGTYTPPFRPLKPHEVQDLVASVQGAQPHILWLA
jgi:N-acetylglucosaminyldiphosphoundecaprenol N-acetyl-beta-D-mannosaminyltransferase